jgi:putative acetyltransferase
MLIIRRETEADWNDVCEVNERAFGRPDEADLVDKLREANAVTLSLVGVLDGRIIAHVLFSPVVLEMDGGRTAKSSGFGVGLGPVAVLPEYQNQGFGSQLIWEGIRQCREVGHGFMVVLGHPEYYPRFGFQPSVELGIRSQFDVPSEVFMVMEFKPEALHDKKGLIKYRPEFGA